MGWAEVPQEERHDGQGGDAFTPTPGSRQLTVSAAECVEKYCENMLGLSKKKKATPQSPCLPGKQERDGTKY